MKAISIPAAFIFCLLIGCTRSDKSQEAVQADSVAVDSVTQPTQPTESVAQNEAPIDSTGEEEEERGPFKPPGSQQKWNYIFHGFSPNLAVAAFEATGIYESPNWNQAQFCVVDVNKNDYATPSVRSEYEGEMPDSLRNVIDQKLTKFKLPVKTGYTKTVLGANQTVMIKGLKYELDLFQYGSPEGPPIFQVLLRDPGGNVWVLQKDSKLPKSRGRPTTYRLEAAYVQDSRLAVMIEYDAEPKQDAESYYWYGTQYLMVTGNIQLPPTNPAMTLTCTFQDSYDDACHHLVFDCFDLGAATFKVSAEAQKLVNDLTIQKNGKPALNPKYKGKSFYIVSSVTGGTPCFEAKNPNPRRVVELVREFSLK